MSQRVEECHVISREAESSMNQAQGQRRLARTRAAAEEQDAFISKKRGRVDGKLIGGSLENLGQQLPFQHRGKFVGGARRIQCLCRNRWMRSPCSTNSSATSATAPRPRGVERQSLTESVR